MTRGGIDGVSKFFDLQWESAEVVRMAIRPDLINAAGLLSGVATYALVDYCMGSTLWRETTEEEAIATISIAINYVATATEGDVICRTTLDRRNRRLAVLRSEVTAGERDPGAPGQAGCFGDEALATAIGSYTIFPRRKTQPEE